MKPYLTFALLALGLLGCGPSLQRMAYPPVDIPRLGPDELQAVAYARYAKGDYVRALRFAYTAAQTDSSDRRLPLLIGLIYDVGLDRPDLAVPEYERALALPAPGDLRPRLRQRIHHLYRKTLERRAAQALRPGAEAPLAHGRLAIFPLRPVGPKRPDPGLRLGLIDLLLHSLQAAGDTLRIEPLKLHTLHHAFQTVRPGASAADFARWTGADRTLTGDLIDLGRGDVRVRLRVLGPEGEPLYEAPPVSADLRDLQVLHQALLTHALEGLGLPLTAALPPLPVASHLVLAVHGKCLAHYLSGQLEEAYHHLVGLRAMDPASALVARTYRWVDLDLAGRDLADGLMAAYRRILELPDPQEAARARAEATHSLTVPPSGVETGIESHNPYKPPSVTP